MRNMTKSNPRFVWNVGAIAEQFPDMADVQGTVLWDRQERKPVLTLHEDYSNAFCLETTPCGAPLTLAETWFNSLDNKTLESENLTPTEPAP